MSKGKKNQNQPKPVHFDLEEEEAKRQAVLDAFQDDMEIYEDHAEKYGKYREAYDLMREIDLSVLENCEAASCMPKRRKGKGQNAELRAQKEKEHLEKIETELENVKKALNKIYEMQYVSFKSLLSKTGMKRKVIGASKLPFIDRIHKHGDTLPLWVGMDNEAPPPLCGAIPAAKGYIGRDGDLCAAYVVQDETKPDVKDWILAEVKEYDNKSKHYKVDDIDEDAVTILYAPKHLVVVLPKYRADPENNPEAVFPEKCQVLALYPGTTCFFRAFVHQSPKKPGEPYMLKFEDETIESGYSDPIPVSQMYVLHYDFDT